MIRQQKHQRSHETSLVPVTTSKTTGERSQNHNVIHSGSTFVIDRKGDQQNVQYGSLDKYKVPRYRSAGYGRLVGLDRRFRITTSTDTKREIQDEADDATRKNRNVSSLTSTKVSDDGKAVRVATGRNDRDFENQQNFISFSKTGSNKRRKLSQNEGSGSGAAYPEVLDVISDSGASSASSSDNEIDEDSKDTNTFEQFRNHPDNKRQIELLAETDKAPNSVEAWMALVDHQERYFLLTSGNGKNVLTSSDRGALADLRISLYEKAMSRVGESNAKEKLYTGYMQEGSKLWDTKQQLTKWRNILDQSQSLSLWYQFLNFQQSNAVVFSYDQCLRTYAQVMEKVHKLKDPGDRNFEYCYVVLRLTTFMHQAGYSERAIAIWQAVLEYNFFRPASVTPDEASTAFESFWDSEVARIGEKGSKGWNQLGYEVDPQVDPPIPSIGGREFLKAWGDVEEQMTCNIMPARTLDETVEDDPYRVIISSDMVEFLHEMTTEQGRQDLLQAFLKFVNLPAIYPGTNATQKWWDDLFLGAYELRAVMTDASERSSISHFQSDTNSLFPHPNLGLSLWNNRSKPAPKMLEFAVATLIQLADIRSQDDVLAEYLVALKFQIDPSSARKYTKRLLKQRQDSLRLYNAYALIEARSNKFDVAVTVWSTALSMASSLGHEKQKQSIHLWYALVLELLQRNEHENAFYILMNALPNHDTDAIRAPKGTASVQATPGQHLKAEAFYQNRISDSLTSKIGDEIVICTDLLAFLRYLSSNHNLTDPLQIYQNTLQALSTTTSTVIIERIHQSQARLLHLHAQTAPTGYRPSDLLTPLRTSRILFPTNSIFHNLYNHYSRRAGITDRLRDLNLNLNLNLDTKTKTKTTTPASTLISSLLQISTELSRPTFAGSTPHSIRSSFTAATTSHPTNPQLHLDRLNWETTLTPFNEKTVRDLYLTALRACPWVKELYLWGFKMGTAVLSAREARDVYLGLVDRGIRVRVDVLELVEGMEG